MSMSNFEAAQLLWQARDEMDAASDEMRAAQEAMAGAAGDMAWRSVAARRFSERVAELADEAAYAMSTCADEASVLLARGNAAVLS
ncbi:hypothetical protein [Microbacterium karelineae]|uniref:hypothetical protein n=1 Tax=Microbacterium karelineae TaxID=2654283 RepID=UPI0012EA553A|nr:hypothetical protein [Microbacterium karelineae]